MMTPMKSSKHLPRALAVCLAFVLAVVWLAADTPKANRINRAIELLDQGQPVYYTGCHEGTEGSFEEGVKDAQTCADYFSYDMEHARFDVKVLAEYIRGLVKCGSTKRVHLMTA